MKVEAVSCCRLCGKSAELRHESYPGYQEPHTFQIYHCVYCNTAFTMPIFFDSQTLYNLIYSKGKSVPGYNRYWEYAQNVKTANKPLDYLAESEATYWGVREALLSNNLVKSEVRILELGSGLGYLTYSLRQAGYNVCGLDISETAVELAKDNYGDFYTTGDLFDYAENNKCCYDVVILTEVIEHVDAPMVFLETVLKLLKKGGKAIITTPNKSLYSSDILWKTESPPIHCWWLSESSMNYIAVELGAKSSFVDFSKFYQDKYLSVSLQSVKNDGFLNPVFDKYGNINIKYSTEPKSKIRSFFAGIYFFKMMHYYMKILVNKDIIKFGNRGPFLCAIFEKNNT